MIFATLLLSAAPASPAQSESPDAPFEERFTSLAGTQPAQWRVTFGEYPAHEALVSWSTAEAGEVHRVRYAPLSPQTGEAGAESVVQAYQSGAYTRREEDVRPGAWYHHVRLAELQPSTTYRFVIESDDARSRELHFTTAPVDDRPFSILVGGDSRSGWRARCYINLAIAGLAGETDPPLAFSHGGDYVMYGPSWDEWSRWLTHLELCTADNGRVLPIIPTRGNHDVGPLYDEIFDTPGGEGRNYFHTRLAPGVSLLTLNSNIPVAGDQLTWLEAELAAAEAGARWLLASYHAALYPAVKPPGPAKSFWPPLFDQYGVDLVLESDGHAIKRTPPIRGDELHPEGVVYVGEGGLGVPQRNPRSDAWYLKEPGMVTRGHHVIRLDVSNEALRARFLKLDDLPPNVDPDDYQTIVPPGSPFAYLGSDDAPAGWTSVEFDDAAWPVGEAGFGYGDEDDSTVLHDMRGNYARVHLRTTIDDSAFEGADELHLMCRYDDAFVAFLNGHEIVRVGVTEPSKPGRSPRIKTHEARELEAFPIEGWREYVRDGMNVLALVGYNRMRTDKDFTLDPWLAGDRKTSDTLRLPGLTTIDDTTLAPRTR